MGKPYTLLSIDENGNEVRLYEDGTKRNQLGHTLELPAAISGHPITSENAHTFHKLRKQKTLEAIERKLVDVTKTNAPADAIAHIVGKRAEIAMRDETRTGNEAAKIVLQAVDAYQDKQTPQQQTTIRNEYAMDDETKELLHAILRERRDNRQTDDYTNADVEE